MKTVRLSMLQAETLISTDPSVKVIHLIRDLRAIIESQRRVWEMYPKLVKAGVHYTCSRLLQNIEVSKSISKKFPNRILTVRYEDIAESPVIAAKQLYRFLDLEMNPSIEHQLWNMTYAGKQQDCSLCTSKANSTETAYMWRKAIDTDVVYFVQKTCFQIFNIMGYRLFESENDVRNVHISSKYKTFDSDFMRVSI